MKKHTSQIFFAALLTAMFALLGIGLFASTGNGPADDQLVLTGWLHVEDPTVQDVVLVVELENEQCTFAEIQSNGKFTIHIPVNAKARLIFLKPGHLTKEVVLDTRNALNTKNAEKLNSKVKFDVVLESEEARLGKQYDGPVGAITFINGSGLMKVQHDQRLVPIRQAELAAN